MKKSLLVGIALMFLLSLTFASAQWNAGLEEGLKAYWNFNETSGSVAEDTVSGLYNGSILNIELAETGKIGNGYGFRSTTSAVNLNKTMFNDNFTLSYWVNISSASTPAVLWYHAEDGNNEIVIRMENSSSLRTWAYQGAYKYTFFPTYNLGEWTHHVLQWDMNGSEGVCRFWVNGIEEFNETSCGFWIPNAIQDHAFGYSASLNSINMSLDEIAWYDRHLSPSEILELYNGGDSLPREAIPVYEIILTNPLNNTATNIDTHNFSANFSFSTQFVNSTFYIYNSSDDLINETFYQPDETLINISVGTVFNLTSDGDYYWFYKASELGGAEIFSEENYTIRLDTEPPFLTWNNPSTPIFQTGTTYLLNVSMTDPYLDAVNVTIYNSSLDEIYNNFSDYINETIFDVLDLIPLNDGENIIEVCARDSLTSSPHIRDLLTWENRFPNDYDADFDIELDNGVKIRRTTYVVNNGGIKIRRGDYNLVITDNWDAEGKHIKTDITSDKLQNQNWGIRIDFECIEGCDKMIYLNDRGRDRIIDSGRNLYFNYDDAVAEGWDVQYSQEGNKASAVISYPDNTFYNSQPSRHTIDPITAGLNNICENETITVDSTNPTATIIYPADETIYDEGEVTGITYTYVEENPDSVWFSANFGETNSTIAVFGENLTGLTADIGINNWTIYFNDTFGNEGSFSVGFYIIDVITAEETNIYQTMNSAGKGLGIFIQTMASSLPRLILNLGLIAIMIAIAIGLVLVIRSVLKQTCGVRSNCG